MKQITRDRTRGWTIFAAVTDDLGRLLAGRYRVVGLLGRGGMGAVWRARDERLGREVAVKELRLPEHLDTTQRAGWIARLDREARAAARLKHPGIITVHDRITGEDGRPWIVMELVNGRSLADLISTEGPLPPHHAAGIGLQVLSALQAAHQAGITHRDIKPANVLLEDGRVVLTDFGIAALEGDATLTRSGAVLGTPAYMSPEQVHGAEAVAESDLSSLGASLYTAVEGRPPFEGTSTGAVFVAIATQPPAPTTQAGLLEPAISGLLRKNPADRPTADQLHALLTQALQPAARQPFSPPVSAPPRHRHRPLLAVIIAAALVLTVAVAVAGYALWPETSTVTMPGASMEPTLHNGQRLKTRPVKPGAYRPRRGDVIVFQAPGWRPEAGNDAFVMRVIGIPGDKVSCCDAQKRMIVNGPALDEKGYLPSGAEASSQSFSIMVPDGRLWVMGDNRSAAADSRSHMTEQGDGTIPADRVTAVVSSNKS